RKEVDDVLGGEEAWRGVETVEAMCEKCGHDKAYFMQLQIRSADEPMTLFYPCNDKPFGKSEVQHVQIYGSTTFYDR
ncbi:RNA polymerase III C11 subunit, partial [Coemansia sp. RSA 1939]